MANLVTTVLCVCALFIYIEQGYAQLLGIAGLNKAKNEKEKFDTLAYRLVPDEVTLFEEYRKYMGDDKEYQKMLFEASGVGQKNKKLCVRDLVRNVYVKINSKFGFALCKTQLQLSSKSKQTLTETVFFPAEQFQCLQKQPKKDDGKNKKDFDGEIIKILQKKVSLAPEEGRNLFKDFLKSDPIKPVSADLNEIVRYLLEMIVDTKLSAAPPSKRAPVMPLQLLKKRLKDTFSGCLYSFDSIVHALGHVYMQYGKASARIDEAIKREPTLDEATSKKVDAELLRFIVVFTEKGASDQIYQWRKEILEKVGKSAVDVEVMMERFVTPLLTSMRMIDSCDDDCKIQKTCYGYGFLVYDNDLVEEYGLSILQRAISPHPLKESESPELCRTCQEPNKIMHVYNDIVFILNTYDELVLSEEIPPQLFLDNQPYALRATIDELPDEEHVISSCRMSNGKWAIYDDKKSKIGTSPQKDNPILFVYERIAP